MNQPRISIDMTLNEFLSRLSQHPEQIEFSDTMAVIDTNYLFTPVDFVNGDIHNKARENSGSSKIFSFAQLHELSPDQTLACFGQYYRDDVLNNLESDNHSNIRSFMKHGWAGIRFSQAPLVAIDSSD